jgi:hypothetical protein
MKWLLLIWDPDSLLINFDHDHVVFKKLVPNSIDLEAQIFYGAKGNLVDFYDVRRGDYDHTCFLYDGSAVLDGIAEDTFYTMAYDSARLTHFNSPLVDYKLKTPYVSGNELKIFAELFYQFYDTFAGKIALPTDEMTLEEKVTRINEFKQYF